MDKGNLEKIRQSVVEAGLVLAHSSMTIGTYGNISCRVDENHIAITPSGRDYEQLTSADIVVTDLKGDVQKTGSTDGDREVSADNSPGSQGIAFRPSSELPLHLDIFKSFPEARASSRSGLEKFILQAATASVPSRMLLSNSYGVS